MENSKLEIQKKAHSIVQKLEKLTNSKKNICICPVFNNVFSDSNEFYQFCCLSHIGELNKIRPFFEKRYVYNEIDVENLQKKYDFVILYNGIRFSGKVDVTLDVISEKLVYINFYTNNLFSFQKNLTDFIYFE